MYTTLATGTADYSLALHNLALGLAKEGPKGLPSLLSRCPRLPSDSSNHSRDFQERRFQCDFQNERRCAALLALCNYVQAAPVNDRTVGVLEENLLPYLDRIVQFHAHERLKTFPKRFLVNLARLSNHSKFGEKIAASFFQFYQQVEKDENRYLLAVFLEAVGEAESLPPFDKKQTHELLQKMRSLYRSKFDNQEAPKAQRVKMNIHVLLAITNFVRLRSAALGQEDYRTLYALGSLASEELLVPSVRLCLECAKHNDDLGAQAVKLLSTEIMYAVPLFEDNPTENRLTYTALLRGLVELGRQHPNLVRTITQKLLEYLLEVHALQKPDTHVRDQAISSLADIVQQEMTTNGTESIRWVLEYLSHALYSTYNEYMRMTAETPADVRSKKESQLVVIVVSLGRLACHLNDPSISDIVVPTLIGRITYPDLNFDAFIIDQLAEIAVLGQKEVYGQVADLLGNIYKNCLNCPDNMFIHNTIPNAYSRLATGLPADSRLQEDLLIRVFKLFQLIANQIHRKESKSRTAVLGFLGILLPIMGQLLSNPRFQKKSWDPATIKLFSNVWCYCVVYRFAYQKEWTPAWYTAICQIANRLPPLTSEKSTTVLETTLTLESFNLNAQEIANVKRELSEILSRSSANKGIFTQDTVKQLSFGKCLYLLSVYHLETIRAGQGNLLVLFSYLEEPSYRDDVAMSQAINVIAEQVFQVFLQTMINWKSSPEGGNREDILIEVIYVLLLAFVHNEDNVRKAADKYILKLLEAFPQLLWNHKALVTLLDLTQAVSNGAEVQGHATLRLNLPNSDETITLPEDYGGRKSLLDETIELCRVWLQSAKRYAPIETDCVLHEYCQKFQQSSFGFLHHQGFSLIVRMAGLQADSRGDQSTPHYSSQPSASSFVNSLNRKAAYMGEVRGMTILHRDQEIAQLSGQLIEQIKRSLVCMQTGETLDLALFHGDICRAAAFIISQQGQVDRQLLHYLCWAPIVAFQEQTVSTGVFAWTWLLAARPDLGTVIMHEIQDAWHWSIYQGIGLFNSRIVPPSPLSIKRSQDIFDIYKHLQFYKVAPSDPKPHCILIDFLQERLTLVRKNNPEQMELIQNMLFSAIADPQRLSQQASSLAVRFRLLLLCVNFLTEGGHLTEPTAVQLFMERIYAVAVDWFDKPPQWYDPGSRAALEQDVKVLVEFASALDESKPTTFNFPDVSLPQTGIISLVLDNLPSRDVFSRRDTTAPDAPSTTPSAVYKIDAHRTSLLMLLIGHEIDRMSAWHNPQNRIQLKLPDEGRYTAEKVIHGPQWQRYIRTAWGISPQLAVMMGERFPFPKVQSIISHYVQRDPTQAWTIPTAVNHLAKQENVALDHPMLSHLLYWAPSTPPKALALLGPSYHSHPYITQYAIRVLRSFPADTIVFYIPQLVQAIRYDKSGLVEQYVLSASQHSQVLAHQLIWNMQTYSQDPEKTQYPLANKAASMRNEIISKFNPVFRKNYENEFEFFERVTALSGDLMAYPKPEQRVVLKDKLRQIEITPPLYLPTSPDTTVIAINPEKASPMQSAAKVPILVTFIVTHEPALDRPSAAQIKSPERAPRISEVPEEKPQKVRRSTSKKMRKTDPTSSESSSAASAKHQDPRSRPKKTKTRTSRAASHVDLKAAEAAAKEAAAAAPTSARGKRSGSRSESQKNLKESVEEPANSTASTPRKKTKKKRTVKSKTSKKEARKATAVVAGEGQVSQACIFKVGDDVRQDMLALQIVELFKRILKSVDLDLFLYPYRVVATTPDCGIIECVPHAQSRDQIGKQVEGSLYDYFRHRYGPENTLEFQNARNNFLKSMAAYSVVSYILQIKDRHNGNMLIDDFGHIVHIDFGFIFDISPGGGLRFERAPFKLSDEMLVLMGGDPTAEPFKWFVEYTAKAYLAVRQHMESIITLVTLCIDTGFPCFTEQTLSNLRARFCPQKSEREASQFIFQVIIEALSPFSTYTTRFYDVFQHWSNGIDY